MHPAALAVLAFVPMLLEARRSRANEAALRRRGAVEPRDDVYRVMQLAYPACFLAMIGEALLWRGATPPPTLAAGALVFSCGKLLKYWAIGTLGQRWTFRVLVPPDSVRLARGPYRFMQHPNYVGVAGEMLGFALMAGAPVSGAAAFAGFGALMLRRVQVEERALAAGRTHAESGRS